jgi:Matrixin
MARVRGRLLRALPSLVAAAAAGFIAGPAASTLAKAGSQPPPEKRVGLRPGLQLAAMRAGIAAAPATWSGYESHCAQTVAVLTYARGSAMAGNFRDQQTGCYVWLNLGQASLLNAQEICKLALHEMGHLGGLQHSPQRDDVMYAPFESDPIPDGCVSPLGAEASRAARN